MRTLGIAVKIGSAPALPHLFVVVANGPRDNYSVVERLDFTSAESDPVEQIVDLAKQLSSFMDGSHFDSIAIRSAGTSPVAHRRSASVSRAHGEGAAAFVARTHSTGRVSIGDPSALAATAGIAKAQLELLVGGEPAKWRDATLAAVALLPQS